MQAISADSDYGECPTDHSPLVHGSKCCPNYLRSASCSPLTGALGYTDPESCCDGTAVGTILFHGKTFKSIIAIYDGVG